MQDHPVTVLVIEGHPLMRAAICSAIADEPDLTIGGVAARGVDTFEIVQALHPEVILIAVGNPGLEDLAAIKALRAIAPATAILALTSAEVEGQEQAALEAGADAALAKTVQRADLLHSLRKLQELSSDARVRNRHLP